MQILKRLCLAIVIIVLSSYASAQIDVFEAQQSGSQINLWGGGKVTINCSTGMICSNVGGVFTMTSTGGATTFYQTFQNAASSLTQRGVVNFLSGITCSDNAGSTRTDCQLGGNGSLASLAITSASDGVVLAVRRFSASQTNYIQEWQTQSNVRMSGIDKDGNFVGNVTGNVSGSAGSLASAYIDWNAVSGGAFIQNKPSSFSPSAHVLDSATHTITGKTAGQVIRATSATAYSFGALDLANSSAVTGSLPWTNQAHTSANVIGLWASGSCSGYLKSDGTCDTPSVGAAASLSSSPCTFSKNASDEWESNCPINVTTLTLVPFVWEGAVDDANEMTASMTEPTADRTFYIPNADVVVPVVKASRTANQFVTHISQDGTQNTAAIVDADVPDTITASNYLPIVGGTLTGQLVTDNLGIEFEESDTNPTCAAGNYALFADASEGKFKKCTNGTVSDLDTAAASGLASTDIDTSAELRTIVTDESGTGALLFAGGDIGAATATTPAANDSDTSVATTAYMQTELTAYASDTVTLTNKTLDVEGTGNSVTTVEKIWLGAAGCNNATATSFWDLPTSNAPTATCVTGTNTQKGVLAFPDSDGAYSAQTNFALPADWTGAIDAKIKWYSSITTGNVFWQLSTICVADAETDDPAFNTASTVADAAKGTTLQTNDATITGVTATGCAAGELLHLKIMRDRTNASDTLGAAAANLIGVELTMRRAQ